MIYLDNAATSYPKPEKVCEEVAKCMKHYCANPGRGGHALSLQSGYAVLGTRELLAEFFHGSDPFRFILTKNTTEALNIGIKGVLEEGDHVVTTSMEHNSVIRPLKTLESTGKITVSMVIGREKGLVAPEDIIRAIKPGTKMIICTYSSNVNGTIMPVEEIGRIARQKGILFFLDAAQGAGTHEIDVAKLGVDLMAFPGHKGLLGPQGTGGLYIKEGIQIKTLMEGGTGSNSENLFQPEIMPDRFEAGTLNTPGIVGLGSGIRFIQERGINNIAIHNHTLVRRLIDGFREIKALVLYSYEEREKNSGIVAANIREMDSAEVSYLLDSRYRIAVRAGLHCAPLAHKTLGTTETGVVRFSPGLFNSVQDMDYVIHAMREIAISRQ